MKIKTELLNFITGLLLIICGVLNLTHSAFELGMNWVIFGSMYLVMGDYVQVESKNTTLQKFTDDGRLIFSWVGFGGTIVITVYYIRLFIF